MKKEIILIGGGGHSKACIDVIEQEGTFKIAGIVDRDENAGKEVLGYKIFASDKDLPRIAKEYKNFLVAMGHIKNPEKRITLFETLKKLGAEFPVIVSGSALVSRHAVMEEGTIILHGAHVNAGAKIGRNCIVNTSAIIEHDASIGDHSHISTGAVVAGGCSIGKGVFIGGNSVIANNLSITGNSVIGAGSVVVKAIEKPGIYAGNPARKLKDV